MSSWVEAVSDAIRRHVAEIGSTHFTRQGLERAELAAIVADTGTTGITPGQTLGRELQQLRDAGMIAFEAPGRYRWLGDAPDPYAAVSSNAVFVLAGRADRRLLPERGFTFASAWMRDARRATAQWIIYQGAAGYGAAARVDSISADGEQAGVARARIEPGSYVEFGRTVPLTVADRPIEHGLFGNDGTLDARLAARPVRLISAEDFDRILERGLITDDELLPRDAEQETAPSFWKEERSEWSGPFDRATMLVERKVRDRQFRKRVLDAYGERCALTGMKLINGGGRAETQAAHIMSVEAGGPDAVNNGIALSGTVHWMFDRGLISLSDAGEILLSRAINDRDSVQRLINRDRKAHLPRNAAQRPHPDYLEWHRTARFHH